MAQRHYRSLYPELQDSKYFESIVNFEQELRYDTMINMADEVFDAYYDKNNPEQAVYLFFNCVHRPSGSKYNAQVMPMINEKLDKLRSETDTLNVHFANLLQLKAFAYKYQYQMSKAMNYYMQTEDLFLQLNAPKLLLMGLYQSMGSSLINLGEYYRAYSYLKKTLPAFKDENLLHDLAFSYLEMARALNSNQQTALAYEFNKKAHKIVSENFPASYNNVVIPNNLSDNCITLGKYDEALYYSNFADSVMKANDYTDDLYMVYFSILANRGITYKETGNYKAADTYFRELEKQVIKYTGKQSPILPDVYLEYVYNNLESNQPDSAIAYLKKVKAMKPNTKEYYPNLARAYALENDYEAAIQALHTGLPDEQTNSGENKKSRLENFNTKVLLAEYYSKRYEQTGNSKFLDSSLQYVLSADQLLSSQRDATLIGANDAAYAEQYHKLAEIGLSAAYDKRRPVSAETLSAVLQLMSSATAFKLNSEAGKIREFNEAINRQTQLRQQIRAIENKLLAMDSDSDDEKRSRLEQKLFETRIEAFELSYKISNNDTNNKPELFNKISYTEIQKNLPDNEALLVYHLGKKHLYLLVIKKNTVDFNRTITGEDFSGLLNLFYRKIKTAASDFNATSGELYTKLIAPAEKQLENINKITVIPDGMLNRIPFEALVLKDSNSGKFLIENYTVSYHYSVPLWMKSKESSRKTESFTGFAPVFTNTKNTANDNLLSYSENMRTAYAEIQSDNNLVPLPYSETEVKEISRLFTKFGKKSTVFLNEEATEANFKNNVVQSDIVHIATHGLSSYESPDLSGLFFQEEPQTEKITNDGFVYAGEIYMLNIKADLVVLSACKSAAGQIMPGEGVMALPRPFIFVNVPNLVASLWKIHDEKTKTMMIDFYTEILNGQDYAQALRAAKIKSMARGDLPNDWAALILIGR
jgi:CHAT domain-containing protein/tetratricopeptide (TPR) repeat protein